MTRALPICLPAGRSLRSFDPSGWIEEHQAHAASSSCARRLPARMAPNRINGCTGRKPDAIREKVAAIAGKLYLMQHLDVLDRTRIRLDRSDLCLIFLILRKGIDECRFL